MFDDERITPVFTPLLTESMPDVSYASPPVYRRHSMLQVPPDSENLPVYSRRSILRNTRSTHRNRPPGTDHVYELTKTKNRPWATLNLRSGARSPQQMPTFFEDEPIAGTVALSLEKEDSITAISISVTGKVITGAKSGDLHTFLSYSHPLWSKSMGDPRSISQPSSPSHGRFSGKLSGNYSWPFSFNLPKKVTLRPSSAEPSQTYRLPQTFLERLKMASVQYDLTVHFTRTKLRPDSQLRTVLAYIPCIRPREPSMLRQLAYQEGSPLLPPEMDPEGWRTLPTLPVRGKIFNSHPVHLDVNLSLASPLSYTRGTVIPLFITINSRDSQALDLLSSPHAINVRLRRRIQYRGTDFEDSEDFVENAVWWPAAGGDRHSRRLNGEIKLVKDLKPTTSIAHFMIDYSVVVCPFQATGFSCHFDRTEEPLSSEPVEIATIFAKGPRPKAYAPPCYDSGRKPPVYFAPQQAGFDVGCF